MIRVFFNEHLCLKDIVNYIYKLHIINPFVFFNRKASLALLRKMMHYITPMLLDEVCSQEGPGVNFGSQLVEVLSVVLDNEVCFSSEAYYQFLLGC